MTRFRLSMNCLQKHPGELKNILFVAFACTFSIPASGQQSPVRLQDSTGLHAYSVLKGDTILIGFDSAYVLNKRIYGLYKTTYQKMQSKDPSAAKLIVEYESLINLQDSMLKTKEQYYQGLNANFNSLSITAINFADKTDLNVKAINTSLLSVGNEISTIKMLLNESLAKLKKQNSQKLKAAVGGFTVGIALTAVLFLVNK